MPLKSDPSRYTFAVLRRLTTFKLGFVATVQDPALPLHLRIISDCGHCHRSEHTATRCGNVLLRNTMTSRRCRLCDRARDSYEADTRKCRACGDSVCPECAKHRYQVEPDEIEERPKNDRDPGNDDQPALPWRCSDCFLRKPTKFLRQPKMPPLERLINAAILLVDETNPRMVASRKLGLLVAVRTYQRSKKHREAVEV